MTLDMRIEPDDPAIDKIGDAEVLKVTITGPKAEVWLAVEAMMADEATIHDAEVTSADGTTRNITAEL